MSDKRKRLQGGRKPSNIDETSATTPEELAQKLFSGHKPGPTQIQRVQESGITLDEDGKMRFNRFELSSVGLSLPDDTSPDEWQEIGRILLRLQARLQWLLGDWLAFGEEREWGETYQALAKEFGYQVPTLHNMSSVARRVEFSRRRENLSFGHHEAVAALDAKDQTYWLHKAEDEKLTRNQLRQAIREASSVNSEDIKPILSSEEIKAVRRALQLLTTYADEDLKRLDEKNRKRALESASALESIAERLREALTGG